MNLAPPRSIPVWANVRDGITIAWNERRALAAPATLLFLLQLFVFRFLPSTKIDLRNPPPGVSWEMIALTFVATFAIAILSFGLGVGLQRRLLLNEGRSGLQLLSFGRPFWRSFGSSLLIALIAIVIAFGMGMPLSMFVIAAKSEPPVAIVIGVLGGGALLYVLFRSTLRLVLTLPGGAVGLPERTHRVWDASRHIWWHMLGIVLLYFGIGLVLQIPTLILGGIDALTSQAGDLRPGWLSAIYNSALQVAGGICPAVTWALAYRQVFGDTALAPPFADPTRPDAV
jgi:hypothetical protein